MAIFLSVMVNTWCNSIWQTPREQSQTFSSVVKGGRKESKVTQQYFKDNTKLCNYTNSCLQGLYTGGLE